MLLLDISRNLSIPEKPEELSSMYRTLIAAIRKSSILAVTVCYIAVAHAQPSGTNLSTPPPNNSGVGDVTPAMPQPEPGFAAEPVIPAESTRRRIPNVSLLVTGAVLLGGSYGASAIVAATSSRSADDKLYYPLPDPGST